MAPRTRVIQVPGLPNGVALLADGSASAPSWAFGSDPDNGAYRAGADDWHLVVGGSTAVRLTTAALVFNEDGADRDTRFEADANANLLVLDAGIFAGVGQVSFGAAAQATPDAFFIIDPPALTNTANAIFSRALVNAAAAVTIPAGTAASVASLSLVEPNITATGTVTDATTLRIVSAPTEGTRNWYAYMGDPTGATAFGVSSGGTLFLGDNANANMTIGLTINQAANDDEALALKSSDVAHGITTYSETDTYADFGKITGAAGGLRIDALTEASEAFLVIGLVTTEDATRTTAAVGAFRLDARLKSGTGAVGMTADRNILVVQTADVTRYIFDSDGSAHADVEWIAFDSHDDLAALDQLQAIATSSMPRLTPERYGRNPIAYFREDFEHMGIVGKDSWHTEYREDGRVQERQMVNFTRLSMLHHGAILQVADRVMDGEQRLLAMERKLVMLEARN